MFAPTYLDPPPLTPHLAPFHIGHPTSTLDDINVYKGQSILDKTRAIGVKKVASSLKALSTRKNIVSSLNPCASKGIVCLSFTFRLLVLSFFKLHFLSFTFYFYVSYRSSTFHSIMRINDLEPCKVSRASLYSVWRRKVKHKRKEI